MGDTFAHIKAFASAYRNYAVDASCHSLENLDYPIDLFDDRDGDGVCDSDEECFRDPNKINPGQCGCNQPDFDTDGDGVADCNDRCAGVDNAVFGPECEGAVGLPADARQGEIVSCDDCGAELELLATEPVSLAIAPEVEEDWGE